MRAKLHGESTKCPWVGVVESSAGGKNINPTTPTQGHFVLSPVSLASRDQDDGPVELNDRHLRSHRKIGDCEQSRRIKMAPTTRIVKIGALILSQFGLLAALKFSAFWDGNSLQDDGTEAKPVFGCISLS